MLRHVSYLITACNKVFLLAIDMIFFYNLFNKSKFENIEKHLFYSYRKYDSEKCLIKKIFDWQENF